MNAWTPAPAELNDAKTGGAAAPCGRHEQHLQMLDRLAGIGMEIAEAIGRQATQPDADSPSAFQGDLAMAYGRVARAVRMTIALSARLLDEQKRAARSTGFAVMERKERIERIVSRVVSADEDDEETVEQLVSEAAERLNDGDIYGDVMRRPVSEIIDEICRDLGVEPDWSDLAREGWAREEMVDGPVGAPLAEFAPPPPPPPSSPPCLSRGPIDATGSELLTEDDRGGTHAATSPATTVMGPRNACEGDGENEDKWLNGS